LRQIEDSQQKKKKRKEKKKLFSAISSLFYSKL